MQCGVGNFGEARMHPISTHNMATTINITATAAAAAASVCIRIDEATSTGGDQIKMATKGLYLSHI